MKFSARTSDRGSIETFAKVLMTVSKLSKLCALRITVDRLYFIQNENQKEHSHKLWLELVGTEFFDEFRMDGFSAEFNEIFLQLHPDELMRAVRPATHPLSLKMRLTKKGTPAHPHLTLEINQQPIGSMNASLITQDIPVDVLKQTNWMEYPQPTLPKFQVGINLPQLKIVQKVVSGMKNMSPKFVVLMANNEGEFRMQIETDIVTVSTYFTDLENVTLSEEQQSDRDALKEFYSVRVDIRTLSQFLANQHLTYCRLFLNISHRRLAHFTIDQEEMKLQYFVPSVML